MNNDKGLSLLEVLAAVTILSFIILLVSYLFTKNYEFSAREGTRDMSVNVARSVIEDLKPALKAGTSATLTSAANHIVTVNDIDLLRDNTSNTLTAFQYIPADTNTQLDITINEVTIPNDKSFVIPDAVTAGKSFTFQVNQYFSQIEVEVFNSQLNTRYTLQSYLEKR